MLTSQGNTQVYSPFGSYVVEQHRLPCEQSERAVEETTANKWQLSEQELPKAA